MWRSLTQYHPVIGYTFIPGIKARVPHEGGGYLVRVNEQGFRCDHDFAAEKQPGQRRVLVFGDSQTAGDGVSNGDRYSDRLEKLLSGVQVYNFGLPGTGTDQQYLAYQEYAVHISADVLILGVLVENIGRVASRYRPYTDENNEVVIYAKPYYALEAGKLALKNVPVPKGPIPKSLMDETEAKYIDSGLPFPAIRKLAKKIGIRDVAQRVTGLQPVPDYKQPDNPKWVLMRAILVDWIRSSNSPVILVPIPLFSFIKGHSDPSFYQARFREVAKETGAILHDPLADFQKYSGDERREFCFEKDLHLTPRGHQVLAESLAPVVQGLLGDK
jgi:lysophospholipase L1-like esterase